MLQFRLIFFSSFFAAFGAGFVQFFAFESLALRHGDESVRPWLIQTVGALLTLGPVVVYPVSSPLASAFSRQKLMCLFALMAAFVSVAGMFARQDIFIWCSLGLLGLCMGVFSAAKMSCVPELSKQSKKSTAEVNAGLSVALILGTLPGIAAGTWFRLHVNYTVTLVVLTVPFQLASLFASFAKIPIRRKDFRTSFLQNCRISCWLLHSHKFRLIPSCLFWGLGGAATLAATALAQENEIASNTLCSLMPLWAALGSIPGNLFSSRFFEARKNAVSAGSIMTAGFLLLFPIVVISGHGYLVASLICASVGFFFGFSSNLIDSDYLEEIAKSGHEGGGAAFQSSLISFASFLIGGGIGFSLLHGLLTSAQPFFLLAFVGFSAALIYRRTCKS